MRVFGARRLEVADIPFYHLMYLDALNSTSLEDSLCFLGEYGNSCKRFGLNHRRL